MFFGTGVSVGRFFAIAFALACLKARLGNSSPLPQDKCVNFRLDDSQRVYFTGNGQKGSVGPRGLPGKEGPRGVRGERGLPGTTGDRGGKGSKGDNSGIGPIQSRLTAAEQRISELIALTQNNSRRLNTLEGASCKAALDAGLTTDGVYLLQPPGVKKPFQVSITHLLINLR